MIHKDGGSTLGTLMSKKMPSHKRPRRLLSEVLFQKGWGEVYDRQAWTIRIIPFLCSKQTCQRAGPWPDDDQS